MSKKFQLPPITANAQKILEQRYLWKNSSGKLVERNWGDIVSRVATYVTNAEDKFKNSKIPAHKVAAYFADMMFNRRFIPNTPTLTNAGRDRAQLAACYVLPLNDSMEDIMDTLKSQALVQKSGGGCIKEGSKVFTTEHGLIDNDELFDSMSLTHKVEYDEINKAHFIDVANENLNTISFDKANNKFVTTKIIRLWEYNVAPEDSLKIETNRGSTFVTSHYHPFLVQTDNQVVDVKASDLKVGDRLLPFDNTLAKDWPYANINKNTDKAWLLGLFAGDGNIGVNTHNINTKYRIRTRIFNKDENILQHAATIISNNVNVTSKFAHNKGTPITPRIFKESRYEMHILENTSRALGEFILTNMEMDKAGSKLLTVDIPKWILKSDADNIYAFIAGLVDSDGHVDIDRSRVCITTISKPLSNSIAGVLNLLGINCRVREREPANEEWHNTYEVAITSKDDCIKLLNTVGRFIQSKHKSSKLHANIDRYDTHAKDVVVKSISKVSTKYRFFDFTCDINNNYIAGENGLTVIHNTGFDFSLLRERGSIISTTGREAAGPISVIKFMNYMMSEFIMQGGMRYGANMGVMSISHPDIEDFITFKHRDGSCPSFNVSIGITDDFMNAVENNGTWDLISPLTKKVVKTVSAGYLFDLITKLAWETGDPGILFLDTVNKDNPTPKLGKFAACNPCQPEWATVLTPYGISTIGKINIGDRIWSGSRWTTVINKVMTGNKEVYSYDTNAGTFNGTDTHRIVENGIKIEVKDADAIDISFCTEDRKAPAIDAKDVMDGLMIGDGTYHKASDRTYLNIGKNDADYFNSCVKHLILNKCDWRDYYWSVLSTVTPDELPNTHDRFVPNRFRFGVYNKVCGFLRGIFSANGSTNGHRITLKSTSMRIISNVQEMLSSIGIRSYYTTNKEHNVEWDNGEYTSRISYDLNITVDRHKFNSMIGFIQEYKQKKLDDLCLLNTKTGKSTYNITNIKLIGIEQVWDITVDAEEHTYWSGGLLVSNCGEQPLLPNESCTLGHHNLLAYYLCVDSPKSWHECIDWDTYAKDIQFSVRFLDNVVELNHYPLKSIEKMHKLTNRKIGLGVMGFADLLIKLGVPYDSDEALEIADGIAKFHRETADKASCELGKERGSFGSFETSVLAKDWPAMRNACRTTVAPTGTTSIIAGCSTGIEPIFGLILKRQQAGMTMYEFHPEFQVIAEQLPEAEQRKLFEYYSVRKTVIGSNLPEKTQRMFMQSNDVSISGHISMQTAWQKWIDSAISKTINMDWSATVDDVKRAYISAWHKGAKGITVYRDGCRGDQTLSQVSSVDETIKALATSREKTQALCPECGAPIEIAGGCESCKSCGWGMCKLG